MKGEKNLLLRGKEEDQERLQGNKAKPKAVKMW